MPEDRQGKLFLGPEDLVYRAFSRALDLNGRVSDKDFRLRPNSVETVLSVALTPEKAMGELSCRGYVALRAGSIAEIGLTLVRKAAEEDPGYWEIVGIPIGDFDAEQDFAIALAKAAEEPVLVPGRRRRE